MSISIIDRVNRAHAHHQQKTKGTYNMNTSKTISAAAVLDSLSPKSVKALEEHFRGQILSTLTATLGSPVVATAVEADDDVAAPAKRGPGRPAGSKNKAKAEVEAPAKRGPGRPAGSKNKAKAEAPAKRGPGRPAGSKNKPKADLGPSGRAKASKAAAGPTPRVRLDDGRTASQVVRDFDEKYTAKHGSEAPAANVVAHCEKLGLDIKPSLVYNVRQNVKKAAEAAKASRKAKKAAK
jgi:hypothetical protein